MSDTDREPPKRLRAADVIDAQQAVIDRLTQPRANREERPRITLKRSTASGSLGVVGIDVDVPVCEEFPTAKEAHAEAVRLMDVLCAHYPMPDGFVRAVK